MSMWWLCAFFPETNAVIEDGVKSLDFVIGYIFTETAKMTVHVSCRKVTIYYDNAIKSVKLAAPKMYITTSHVESGGLAVWELCI